MKKFLMMVAMLFCLTGALVAQETQTRGEFEIAGGSTNFIFLNNSNCLSGSEVSLVGTTYYSDTIGVACSVTFPFFNKLTDMSNNNYANITMSSFYCDMGTGIVFKLIDSNNFRFTVEPEFNLLCEVGSDVTYYFGGGVSVAGTYFFMDEIGVTVRATTDYFFNSFNLINSTSSLVNYLMVNTQVGVVFLF